MIILNECSGIYRIDCNGECVYVGQSINLKSRKSSHLRKLRNNNHYNIYLQRLYNKYGENFIFNKIEPVISKVDSLRIFFVFICSPIYTLCNCYEFIKYVTHLL